MPSFVLYSKKDELQIPLLSLFLGIIIFFSGTDTLSFKLVGFTIRYSFFYYAACLVILIFSKSFRLPRDFMLICIPLIASHMLSPLHSINATISTAYFLWLMFSIVAITGVTHSIASKLSIEQIVKVYNLVFVISGSLVILQFVTYEIFGDSLLFPMSHNDTHYGYIRPSLWFFESSYLATCFSFYYGTSLYSYFFKKDKNHADYNYIFAIVFLVFSISTTGYITIAAGACMVFFIEVLHKRFSIKKYCNVLLVSISAMAVQYLVQPAAIKFFLGRLFYEDIYTSSGARMINNTKSLGSIWDLSVPLVERIINLVFGIGSGCYTLFFGFLTTNVVLEILFTLGLFGLLACVVAYAYLARLYYQYNDINLRSFVFSLFLFGVILQANSNYLRPYLWVQLGLTLAIYSLIRGQAPISLSRKIGPLPVSL